MEKQRKRTKITKWGKTRPYEVFIAAIWLATWLLFSCPEGFGMTAKLIWIFVIYVLANSICYTFLNANKTPYLVRAFKSGQIVKQTSYGSIITMLAAVIFNMTFPVLMGSLATSGAGWSTGADVRGSSCGDRASAYGIACYKRRCRVASGYVHVRWRST